jgi:hypothetical protein
VRWLLLAAFAGTAAAWLLAVFVPAFQGWRHIVSLSVHASLYLIAMLALLQGFRLFHRGRTR